jgi:hypothetical protein
MWTWNWKWDNWSFHFDSVLRSLVGKMTIKTKQTKWTICFWEIFNYTSTYLIYNREHTSRLSPRLLLSILTSTKWKTIIFLHVKEQLKAALQHFKNLAAKASLGYILTFNGLFWSFFNLGVKNVNYLPSRIDFFASLLRAWHTLHHPPTLNALSHEMIEKTIVTYRL